jgi:hypothetical protein
MGRTTREDRRKATEKAAKKYLDKFDGNQSAAARAAQGRGIRLLQPMLGKIKDGEKIGEKMTDFMAAIYDTTPDGLVRIMLGGKGGLALRDVQGWAAAKAAAMEELGSKVDEWTWGAADDVVVPTSLRRADTGMVIEIVRFLDRYGQTSGVRKKRAAVP